MPERAGDHHSVLILGAPRDPQVRRLRAALRTHGGRAVVCDAAAFPERVPLAITENGLAMRGRLLPLPRSVYLRSLACSPQHPALQADWADNPQRVLAQLNEKRAMLTSLVQSLRTRGVRIVNDFEANAQHRQKPYQLALLHDAGLPVPRFIATNHAPAVRRFVREVGRAVYKPLAGGATVREVRPQDLSADRLEALQLAPVLFQELVPGTSVRAYVVGRRVVAAAEIHSPELDYRRDERTVVPTRLTPAERRAALKAARVCRMPFTGVDLIRSADRFVVLECNPSPMFATFETKTGLDVAGPLAEYLLA